MGDVNLIGRTSRRGRELLSPVRQEGPQLQQSTAALIKAAIAHLLTGDVAGANNLAERYLAARAEAKDPIVDYRRAQWTWISGRRKAAAQQMGAFALAAESGPLRDIASRAYAELAIWSLMSGDREGAARLAQKALSIAGPASAGNALVARFLAQPPGQFLGMGGARRTAIPRPRAEPPSRISPWPTRCCINQQFQPAMLLFRQMWENGSPTADEGLPVMLAWCYLETGRVKEAAAAAALQPDSLRQRPTPYTGFYIPRMLYLRGLLAEKEGRTGDARAYYDKFLALSGPDPLLWGEEKKVRQ